MAIPNNIDPYGWNHSRAVSALHKGLRAGNIEVCAYAAGFLLQYDRGKYAAWRRVMAFPAEDMSGEGAERVAALYALWKNGYEDDNLYSAIIYLCRLVTGEPNPERKAGQLNREADELKCAVLYWFQSGKKMRIPDEAFDMHTGNGTVADFWAYANPMGPASPWREDAMKMEDDRPSQKKKKKSKTAQPGLFNG